MTVSAEARPDSPGREEGLTTGPSARTDLTTHQAGHGLPSRRGEVITLPCGRCRRELPVGELGRLWRLPALVLTVFRGHVKNEVQGLYCARCRRRLNWCVTFLALLFAFWVLLLSGVLPHHPR
jgi:hypothetical protein